MTEARSLLDSTLSASVNAECLAQCFYLLRCHCRVNISGIYETALQLSSLGIVSFHITRPDHDGKVLSIKALILPKITSKLPLHPVSLHHKFEHLVDLLLADSDFGTPGRIDLLLGANVFSCVVLHGQQFSPFGSPSGFKTHFGWVLASAIHSEHLTGLIQPMVFFHHHRRRLTRRHPLKKI